MSIIMFFILQLLFFTSGALADSIYFPVEKYQLENGLTVILVEDHNIPMVSYHTWYRVGSRNESLGHTGAAHMLEHMMFKGAQKYDGKDFWKILNENGMQNNAFTTYDYTGFYQTLPSAKLELMMDVEVDRMSSLSLRDSDLQKEKEVVKEERRWRVDNNPLGLLREITMSTVFQKNPYGWPVIGTMKDISGYTTEALKKFYATYYVPNNTILVLVGDFDSQKTKKMIQKYYGKMHARDLPPKNETVGLVQNKPQKVILKKNVETEQIAIVFHSVPQGHGDMYALDLLSYLVGGGNTSRLYKNFVYKKQVATSAYAYNWTMKEHGLFSFVVNLKSDQNHELCFSELDAEINLLKSHRFTEKELARAKAYMLKSYLESLMTMDGKAQALAASEIVTGSYENLFKDIDKYQQVQLSDIKRVAEKYFIKERQNRISLESSKK